MNKQFPLIYLLAIFLVKLTIESRFSLEIGKYFSEKVRLKFQTIQVDA
jgi:hypothetical protein